MIKITTLHGGHHFEVIVLTMKVFLQHHHLIDDNKFLRALLAILLGSAPVNCCLTLNHGDTELLKEFS
jgi:hypothetical protein